MTCHNMGMSYFYLGKLKQAKECFERSLKLNNVSSCCFVVAVLVTVSIISRTTGVSPVARDRDAQRRTASFCGLHPPSSLTRTVYIHSFQTKIRLLHIALTVVVPTVSAGLARTRQWYGSSLRRSQRFAFSRVAKCSPVVNPIEGVPRPSIATKVDTLIIELIYDAPKYH